MRRHTLPILAFCSLLAVWMLLRPNLAHADVEACVSSHSEGQLRRDQSEFLEARTLFTSCADDSCPEAIRVECGAMLGQLDNSIPTVVLAARNELDMNLTGVTVRIDGKLLPDALTGRALPVNPGPHEFRFDHPDGRHASLRVVVLEGVKRRLVIGRFEPAGSTAAKPQGAVGSGEEAAFDSELVNEPSSRDESGGFRKTVAIALGAVGVVALGSFSYFAVTGSEHQDELRASCAPRCTDAEADSVRSKYLVADISLVVGLAALGTGGYLYFIPSSSDESSPRARGGTLGLRGTF